MGKDTNIEWCDSTINGTSGCDGCELWNAQHRTCYAGTLQTTRLSKSLPRLYSPYFSDVRMIPGRYAQAASWSDLRGTDRPGKPWLNGLPRCIFVGDLGDTFSRAVTDDYLTTELLGAITSRQGQRHFWILLTKRPKRLAELSKKWGGLPDNVMAMTTVTAQHTAARVADLLDVLCKWKGISCEPLLSAVNLRAIHDADGNTLDSLTGYWGIEGRGWTPESDNRINLVITGGKHSMLITPCLIPQQSDGRTRPVTEPAPTVSTAGAIGLMQPTLIEYYGTGTYASCDEPLNTVTCKPRFGLAVPLDGGGQGILDIGYRMLKWRENARAQSFPDSYQFAGRTEEMIHKQIGNAVPPKLAEAHAYAALIERRAA